MTCTKFWALKYQICFLWVLYSIHWATRTRWRNDSLTSLGLHCIFILALEMFNSTRASLDIYRKAMTWHFLKLGPIWQVVAQFNNVFLRQIQQSKIFLLILNACWNEYPQDFCSQRGLKSCLLSGVKDAKKIQNTSKVSKKHEMHSIATPNPTPQ